MQHGDFTELAQGYARSRPDYAPAALKAILSLCPGSADTIKCADLGAGTGIWSAQLCQAGVTVAAVEPNAAMRSEGESFTRNLPAITWFEGSAEHSTLPEQSFDLVTMATALHWADFELTVRELDRILRPGGLFAALWNSREFSESALLTEIQEKLWQLVPELKDKPSKRQQFCNTLTSRLRQCPTLTEVMYLETFHTQRQTPERYLSLWESVNDVKVRAGEERFNAFMDYVRNKVADLDHIDATYRTKVWLARKPQ